MALTVVGLALTMAIWGFIQLSALDRILVDQQPKDWKVSPIPSAPFINFFRQKEAFWLLIQL